MTRTLALVLGVALATIATAEAQQQKDIMSRPSRSSIPGAGIPGLSGAGAPDATGGTGSASTVPGGSTFSTSMPGTTIPMGAGTQNAPRRPSLGPDYGDGLRSSRDRE